MWACVQCAGRLYLALHTHPLPHTPSSCPKLLGLCGVLGVTAVALCCAPSQPPTQMCAVILWGRLLNQTPNWSKAAHPLVCRYHSSQRLLSHRPEEEVNCPFQALTLCTASAHPHTLHADATVKPHPSCMPTHPRATHPRRRRTARALSAHPLLCLHQIACRCY